MSAFPSNYVMNKVLDHLFKGTAISLGSTRYLALYTTDPTAADTGTEASGGSYARQAISFAAAGGGINAPSGAVTFSSLAAGTYPYYGIRDAASAGNPIVYGALASPIIANTGDDVTIPISGSGFGLGGS